MQIIDINLPQGDPGDFYCPLTGELQMDDSGEIGPSCVAYIPPPAFADARIACPQFNKFWDNLVNNFSEEMWEQVLNDPEGDILMECLERYTEPRSQKLICFRLRTTTLERRVTPEFAEPIHTLGFFYVVDFWSKSQK